MSKFTPGPWTADEVRHDRDQVVRGPDRGPIALVQIAGYPPRIGRANAVLISAAPDILAALEAVMLASPVLPFGVNQQVTAAIAKATGEG